MTAEALKELFEKLYFSDTEDQVDLVFDEYDELIKDSGNWHPFGNDENYFGVIETQQASPIPALVEKITNSIDATLMRRCKEEEIDPASDSAPKSMEEAVELFFPDRKNWDIRSNQRAQAENIQIIADGPKKETSLIIYDNGEGQHPEDFESTFLSLLKGNKIKIHFVQGKFNMGGSGSLVFCGKRRYQLIASRKYDKSGPMGFTIVRRHQLTKEEREDNPRFLHYEFLKINGVIPSFEIEKIDLGLYNRWFETGTVIKLYNYRMSGITDISRDLNLSLNEFLFKPALPLFTIEDRSKLFRYPDTPQPQRELFGLKRRLEKQADTYLEKDDCFSEVYNIPDKGKVTLSVFVFKPRLEGKTSKETVKTIRREFFKNNMSILFSLNGQVHGSYSTEFITRQLKFRLLKDHLLIHVDCSELYPEFRNELFMASRDRLKGGDETLFLRAYLGEQLRKSKLKDIFKRRKSTLALGEGETSEIFKSIAKNISLNPEMMSLLQQAFKVEQPKEKRQAKKSNTNSGKHKEEKEFKPNRYPTFLRMKGESKDGTTTVQIPLGNERVVKFESDAENAYFDRVDDAGDIEIAFLKHSPSANGGGNRKGLPKEPKELVEAKRSSPDQGTIKVVFTPTKDIQIGDSIETQVTLMNTGGEDFIKYFLIKITEPEKQKAKVNQKESEEEPLGLPQYILAYRDLPLEKEESVLINANQKTWEELEASGISVDNETIIHPNIDEEDKLESMIINMNSTVLMNFKRKLSSTDQLLSADKRYITSIYFHSLLLYAASKQKHYEFKQQNAEGKFDDKDLTDYLKDIFSSQYTSFLLNFGMDELMMAMED